MNMYHPTTTQITNLLKKHGVWHEAFEHEPARTSEEAAALRPEYTLNQGAKAMIMRVKMSSTDKKFVMLVLPADMKFDEKKVKALFCAKDIRFATKEEADVITSGIEFGGVPPLGHLFGLEVVADPKIFLNEKIIFNAGDRCFSVAMKSIDYKTIEKPRVEEIV